MRPIASLLFVSAVAFCGVTRPISAQGRGSSRPAVPPARPYVFPRITESTLRNGLRVAIVERHDLPLVAVRTVLTGGAVTDLPGKEGTFALMRLLLNDGTTTRPLDTLAERFARMGGTVSDLGFTTIAANVDSSLTILADLLARPAFPVAAIERVRATRLATARASRTSGNAITSRVIANALYGESHPFARFENEASLASITRDDIVAAHARWVRPPNVRIVIVGDVTPAAVLAAMERTFGSWPAGSGPTIASLAIPDGPFGQEPTGIYLADVPGPNAWILIAGISAPRSSPDVPALEVMNAIYGGVTASRLFTELRERRGLTYGSPSAFLWRPVPAPSIFYSLLSSVAVDRADSAITVVLRELRGIAGERPPTAEEFELGKRNRVASIPLQVETHEAMARQLAELWSQELPLDFVNRAVGGVGSVTRDQVIAAAKRHVDPTRLVVAIVGDAKVLEPKLRAANLGPVYLVDPSGKRIR